jgi:hypothetical protein
MKTLAASIGALAVAFGLGGSALAQSSANRASPKHHPTAHHVRHQLKPKPKPMHTRIGPGGDGDGDNHGASSDGDGNF